VLHDDAPILLRPHCLSFDIAEIGDEHVLDIHIHTQNLGTFRLPATAVMAECLANSLLAFCQGVAA
jgi:hypothetical protein